MFKNGIKLSLVTALSIAVLFTGCGEDSDEAKAYDIQLALDSGDNDKAIRLLGDCSTLSGEKRNKCYLDLGAAYFGKAKFDMISLSKEISKVDDKFCTDMGYAIDSDDCNDAKSKEFNTIIFNKLDKPDLKRGISQYKQIVDNNSSVCNEQNYDSLNEYSKQACLSINPLLIADIVNDDDNNNNTDPKSTVSVSLEQIIEFKEVLQDAVPELKSVDLISILDGDTLDNTKDADGNGVLDSIQATQIALDKANDNTNHGFLEITNPNVYINPKLDQVSSHKITIGQTSGTFYRLTQETSISNVYTTLTTIPNVSCDNNNSEVNGTINGTSILPCVKVKEDGTITSLNDSVVGILNNDGLLESIALATESEDDTKTDEEKVAAYKDNICDSNGINSPGKCVVKDGKLFITQDALLDYMSESK